MAVSLFLEDRKPVIKHIGFEPQKVERQLKACVF